MLYLLRISTAEDCACKVSAAIVLSSEADESCGTRFFKSAHEPEVRDRTECREEVRCLSCVCVHISPTGCIKCCRSCTAEVVCGHLCLQS